MKVSYDDEGITSQKGLYIFLSPQEIPLFTLAAVKGYYSTIKLQSKSVWNCLDKFFTSFKDFFFLTLFKYRFDCMPIIKN